MGKGVGNGGASDCCVPKIDFARTKAWLGRGHLGQFSSNIPILVILFQNRVLASVASHQIAANCLPCVSHTLTLTSMRWSLDR
jgi:hypothetical protein